VYKDWHGFSKTRMNKDVMNMNRCSINRWNESFNETLLSLAS